MAIQENLTLIGESRLKEFLLVLVLFIFSNPLYVERYTCACHRGDGEIKMFTETRSGDKFIDGDEMFRSNIKENDDTIVMYNVNISKDMGSVNSTIISKADLKFLRTTSVLENVGGKRFPQRVKAETINGTCTVTM